MNTLTVTKPSTSRKPLKKLVFSSFAALALSSAAQAAAPRISNVQLPATSSNSATMTWDTDQMTDSQVEFGKTTSFGTLSPIDYRGVYKHSVTLTNLQAGTTYYYRVRSRNHTTNEIGISGYYQFFIGSAPAPTPAPTSMSYTIPNTADQWQVPYTGYGTVSFGGVSGTVLSPMASTQVYETHAALALARRTQTAPLRNFKITVRFANERQLRTPRPNSWECFWLFFNYTVASSGKKKTNYIAFKPTGLELGTAYDELGQYFLWSNTSPKFPMNQISTAVVTKRGQHIEATINGVLVMSFDGGAYPYNLYDVAGSVGLYTEDARVRVYSTTVESLP